jgi:hypothetical protein
MGIVQKRRRVIVGAKRKRRAEEFKSEGSVRSDPSASDIERLEVDWLKL